jgi:hypothetical protein
MPSPQSGQNRGLPAFPCRRLPWQRSGGGGHQPATAQIIRYRASSVSLYHPIKLSRAVCASAVRSSPGHQVAQGADEVL